MSYAISTLWHDRQRYLPGVLAVGFSALLIALQCGLLMGMFSVSSMPVDRGSANVWMGAPNVEAVDLGRPIREGYIARMAAQPEIERCEIYLQGFSKWEKANGATELCMVIGSRLSPDSLGAINALKPESSKPNKPKLLDLLTEPNSVVIDRSDMKRLGVTKEGDVAEVIGVRVKVVGFTEGVKSLAGPYVFCSINTARQLLRYPPDQVTYILGKTQRPEDAGIVAQRLQQEYGAKVPVNGPTLLSSRTLYQFVYGMRDTSESVRQPEPSSNKDAGTITAFTAYDFSCKSQMHWLLKTKAGIALGYAAALGLLVGAVVTSQTLYAATAASLREFAVLRALGIPRWRMSRLVLTQAFFVGLIGILLSLPAMFGAAKLADWFTVQVHLYWWLLTSAAAITLVMAMGSGWAAVRSLRHVEPATLLR